MAWRVMTIGELCEVINGGTPKTGIDKYWSGEHLWITPAEMGKRESPYVDETERKITDAGLRNSSARLLPPNSVILSSRAPIGHLVINTEPMAFNQGCKGLVPRPLIHHKYLFYYLSSIVDLLNALGTGATFKELSGGKLKEVEVPVPPLAEQKRIVAILDEAFEGIRIATANAEKNLANARELFERRVSTVLGKSGPGWRSTPLGEACVVERGSSPRPIKQFLTTRADGVNWVKIGDTREGEKYVHSTNEKITPEGAERSRRVEPGDFILTNSMSFGRPYIMAISGFVHDGWFVLRLNPNIDPDFFYFLLSSRLVQDQFRRLATGAVVQNISSDLVKRAVLSVPPLEEQRTIAEFLTHAAAKHDRLQEHYHAKISSYVALRQSILSRAFSGQLTATKGLAA